MRRSMVLQLATCTEVYILLCCFVGFVNGQCDGRCEDDQYCDEGTRACESCEIYCDPNSPFANERDCNKICPFASSSTSPENDVKSTNIPTSAPMKKDDKKNIILISVSVCAGGICLIAIIFALHHLYKKGCRKLHYPVQVQADPLDEEEEHVL